MPTSPRASPKSLTPTGHADATSPATASTNYVGTAHEGFSRYKALTIIATLTGATGGTTDILIETSADGVDWYEWHHFAQKAGSAAATTVVYSPNPWAGGTTGTATGKNNLSGSTLGTTMVLAVNTAAPVQWLDQLRIRYVTGSGVSAGAVQSVVVVATDDPAG